MKLTTKLLKKIIKEELQKMNESGDGKNYAETDLYRGGDLGNAEQTVDDFFDRKFKKPHPHPKKVPDDKVIDQAARWYLIDAINSRLERIQNWNFEAKKETITILYSKYLSSGGELDHGIRKPWELKYNEYLKNVEWAKEKAEREKDYMKSLKKTSTVDPQTGADLSRFGPDYDPMADGD